MWLINITSVHKDWRLMILKLALGKLNKWFIVFIEFAFSRRIFFGVKNVD